MLQTIFGTDAFKIVPVLCPNPGEKPGRDAADSDVRSFQVFAETRWANSFETPPSRRLS